MALAALLDGKERNVEAYVIEERLYKGEDQEREHEHEEPEDNVAFLYEVGPAFFASIKLCKASLVFTHNKGLSSPIGFQDHLVLRFNVDLVEVPNLVEL